MKLQFTNGYRPRFDQITRILKFLHSQENRKKIPRQEIVAALGIPDKQVENLTSMMTGFGLVKPRITLLTDFGKAVVESDPYFEKIETLWMIHYIVSSNPEWVVWHRIINSVIPTENHFTIEEVSNKHFSDLVIHFSEKTITKKLPTEVGAVFAAYTTSELSHLRILRAKGIGAFVKSDPVDIPPMAFLFCLIYYRDIYSPGSSAMNILDICSAENSPGRVLNLPEYQVRTVLGKLHDFGLIRLEQLANLDQVRFADSLTQVKALKRMYRGDNAN